MRSLRAIANVEAGGQVGYDPGDMAYSSLPAEGPGGDGFEAGSTGRRALILWGASVAWLVFVWRAVRGY